MAHYAGQSSWAPFKSVFFSWVRKKKKYVYIYTTRFSAFSLCRWIKHASLEPSPTRACGDEESFGVFRENFIQPVVLHVPLRDFPLFCQGSES